MEGGEGEVVCSFERWRNIGERRRELEKEGYLDYKVLHIFENHKNQHLQRKKKKKFRERIGESKKKERKEQQLSLEQQQQQLYL